MGFKVRRFEAPSYKEEEKDTKKRIVISCEGENTEIEYFNIIKSKLSAYIPVILDNIKILEKGSGLSAPKHVLNCIDEYITNEKNKDTFDDQHDEFWLVCDRESKDDRKKGLLEVIPQCKVKNYNIAIANPVFELWLLLHLVDIEKYDKNSLYENAKCSSTKRFIDNELSTVLEKGYNKKKNRFNQSIVSVENIKRAIKQEKLFENNIELIIDNIGSNIGELVGRIVSDI